MSSPTLPSATPPTTARRQAAGDDSGAAGRGAGRPFWTLPLPDAMAEIGAADTGLSTAEAESRLKQFGPNNVNPDRPLPVWLDFLGRFQNPLVLILLFASGVSAAIGEISSFIIVAVIVSLSVALDFIQERRAKDAVEALRRSVALRANVHRNGVDISIPADQLVPGDVIRLKAGDLVPADALMLSGNDLFVNQALLTGEPYPVEKQPIVTPSPDTLLDDAANAVFLGTSVISGSATALVCRIGRATALGGLSRKLAVRPPATQFEIGIRRFGILLMRFTILLVLFVLVVNVLFHRPWLESLMFAVALAVGLTPELLPMIVTVTLARGARRLAAQRVIVKHLPAIHNFGAMDVLCTDKTGTLTEARIDLVRCLDAKNAVSNRVFELAYLNSFFETGLKGPLDDAILKAGTVDTTLWHKIDEVPFDFERRRVSVLLERDGWRILVVKGAPEDILRISTHYEENGGVRDLDDTARAAFRVKFEAFGSEGFRALAVAFRAEPADQATVAIGDETELVFAGFAQFLDPPKASSADAISALAKAGVPVVILTGDNERVTLHLCRELAIPVGGVVTGDVLGTLSDEALLGRLRTANIFCRVTPQQKQRVIGALKRAGRVVGFLGDGINDAPALRTADVGISVDSAADVAKEAADLILLDKDLSVLYEAVIEGRDAVTNVTKYILMGSSSNFGNMFSMAGASLFLPFLPMLPIQVLLNNLLYDVSEMALPFDRVERDEVSKPLRWNIGLIERFMLAIGPISSLFDFLTFYVLLRLFAASEPLFQTGWFVESLATQVLVIFVIRTRRSAWANWPHPMVTALALAMVATAILLPLTPLGAWFGFVALPPAFYAFLIVATLAYLLLVEMIKKPFYRYFAERKFGSASR